MELNELLSRATSLAESGDNTAAINLLRTNLDSFREAHSRQIILARLIDIHVATSQHKEAISIGEELEECLHLRNDWLAKSWFVTFTVTVLFFISRPFLQLVPGAV